MRNKLICKTTLSALVIFLFSATCCWAADTKITALPDGTATLAGTDYTVIAHDPAGEPVTQRVTVAQILALVTQTSLHIDDILTEPFKLDKEGYLQIPDKPGLGIDLDLKAVKKFARTA